MATGGGQSTAAGGGARGGRGWPVGRLRAVLAEAAAILLGRRAAVDGASMYPLLRPGDRVLFDRLAYLAGRPRRGDVVLARGPERRLIKLVAGLPGETLEVARDRLWVDGRRLDLPDGRPMVGSLPGRWELGPDEYFLLSHAVAVGIDSRHFGAVGRDRLLGRGLRVYWPSERRRRLGTVAFEVWGGT
jgi:signal peptidase I